MEALPQRASALQLGHADQGGEGEPRELVVEAHLGLDSDRHFRNTASEYARKAGVKWMHGAAKCHGNRTLGHLRRATQQPLALCPADAKRWKARFAGLSARTRSRDQRLASGTDLPVKQVGGSWRFRANPMRFALGMTRSAALKPPPMGHGPS